MPYEIKEYDSKFIEKQVDLIWEVTDTWKFPYQTSYDSLKQSYSSKNFDPSTRFYAFENEELIGFITAAIVRNEEKGDYGTLRLPITKHDDEDLQRVLLSKVEDRFKSLSIKKIRAPAGVGMGNMIELANKFGFTQKSSIFIRAKEEIESIKVSGNHDLVKSYNDESHKEKIIDIFTTKMGIPEEQGKGFHAWAYSNKTRKQEIDPFRADWKLIEDGSSVKAFSYLHISDHNPKAGHLAPIWLDRETNFSESIDSIISSHLELLIPHGIKTIGTYLNGSAVKMESLYSEFGFKFEHIYSYEKEL